MKKRFNSYVLGLLPDPLVSYSIEGDYAYTKKGLILFGHVIFGNTENVPLDGASVKIPFSFLGFGNLIISNSNCETTWKYVWFVGSKAKLISDYKAYKEVPREPVEIRDQEIDRFELTEKSNDQTISANLMHKEEPDPVEDKWYAGYELLDELVHIPALPEKLWKMLVDRSGYTTPSAIKWLVNDGDYIKRGQVIGKLILYRHKRKSFIKPKEEDCIFDIKSPTYGKIKEYTGIKGTEYFRRKLSTLQERSSYDYVAPMFLVQKVRGPDMDYPVTSYSMELFVEGFNNACWSWLRHEDKTIEQGGRIPLIDQMRRARIRSELISYETMYAALIEKDKKLEDFACKIPFPSRLLMDAALHEKKVLEERTHIKTGQWIEKGEKIASYKGYNKDVSIVSPITGKVIFCGLNSKILEDLHTSPSDYSAFGLWPDKDSVHNPHPQDFSDRYRYHKNLPVNLYDNKVYGVARNVVAIIQPEKGSKINPDNYVQEAFSEILKAARNYIDECYSSDQEYYETVIGQEIQKVEDCKGDFLGTYEITESKDENLMVSKIIQTDKAPENTSNLKSKPKITLKQEVNIEDKNNQAIWDSNLDNIFDKKIEEARVRWDLPKGYTRRMLNSYFEKYKEDDMFPEKQLEDDYLMLEKKAA